MKRDQYSVSSITEILQKEKIGTTFPYSDPSFYHSASKKTITHSSNFQPITLQSKQIANRNTEQCRQSQPNPQRQVHEKIKGGSLTDRQMKSNNNNNTKIEYLAFLQRQHKQEKQKKHEESKQVIKCMQNEGQHKHIKEEMIALKAKMEKYLFQLQKRDEIIMQKDRQLSDRARMYEERNRQSQNWKQRITSLERQCINYQNGYNLLYQRLQQLQIQCQQHAHLQEIHQQTVQKCNQLQFIFHQKNSQINEIMIKKDAEYNALAATKNQEIRMLTQRLDIMQAENQRIMADLNSLSNQMQYSHQLDNQQRNQINAYKFESIVKQLESRVDFYIQENLTLKQANSQYQGDIQRLQHQINSMKNTIQAYEARDHIQLGSAQQQQIQLLRQALDQEKQESDKLFSHQQLEILKLQNQLSIKKYQSRGSLIDIFDEERLHQSLYLALEEIERLKAKLAELMKSKK